MKNEMLIVATEFINQSSMRKLNLNRYYIYPRWGTVVSLFICVSSVSIAKASKGDVIFLVEVCPWQRFLQVIDSCNLSPKLGFKIIVSDTENCEIFDTKFLAA